MNDLRTAASRRKDLTGQRFGRLVALKSDKTSQAGQALWHCVCDCGATKDILSHSLTSGRTTSCGCYHRELSSKALTTHGFGRTRTAAIWRSMVSRCTNQSTPHYAHYGARGITVCDRWLDFTNFLGDMGECPDGHSIERIDNDGPYAPDNCTWIPKKLQVRNRRNTLKYEGKPLAQIAEEMGVNYDTLYSRFKKYGNPYGAKA